jgi:hypothetical protein
VAGGTLRSPASWSRHSRRTEDHIKQLAEAQRQTEEEVRRLARNQALFAERREWLTHAVGDLKGRALEQAYRDKASAYFGPLLRRLQVVDPYTLEVARPSHARGFL